MKRDIEKDLLIWKNNKFRKPLILKGARQVGKTYTVKKFGEENYDNVVYINFEQNLEIRNIFINTKDPLRILDQLRIITGINIIENKTLIFFDEIQECGEALNSLKYFCEEASGYHIIAAGSLLGIYLSNTSFPVGKVEFLDLSPISFTEFLTAKNLENHVNVLENFKSVDDIENINLLHNSFLENLKIYYAIGGMPEAVKIWVEFKDIDKVKKVQYDILESYIMDFSKHVSSFEANKIKQIFESLPSQLSKENKKFLYSAIKSGARAREYESALNWLIDANIVTKVSNVRNSEIPLKGFEDLTAFKIYLFEIGLLINMAYIDASALTSKDFITMYNGVISENFVLNHLKIRGKFNPYYYTFKNYEIDYLIEYKNEIIPLEVKSGKNLVSNSLNNYILNYQPKCAIKFSTNELLFNEKIINVPIYMVQYIDKIIDIYNS